MGYFPNGTSGMIFEEEWCAHCVHEDDESGCPVMLAHIVYGYDERQNKPLVDVLDMLIPESKEGEPYNSAKECKMFVPSNPSRCTKTPDMFQPRGEDA